MNDRPANSPGPLERREVYYSGRVQGVGFRYTTRDIASRLPVTGFVRNLPDGRVQLVVEGASADLDALLGRVGGELGRFITGCDVKVSAAGKEYSEFEIAF